MVKFARFAFGVQTAKRDEFWDSVYHTMFSSTEAFKPLLYAS